MNLTKLFKHLALFSAYSLSSGTTAATTLSDDLEGLEGYLLNQESKHTDIVRGTEKSIRWFDGTRKTQVSIVYIHGFSASAGELSPVTELLADEIGANVFFTRLAGHGRSGEAMAEANIEKWLNDTKEAWEIGSMIGDQVIIVSASTGGTLASWLAAQPFAEDMLANIMISPNFGIASRVGEIVRWGWGLRLAKWVNGPYRGFTPQNELHKLYWTERYPMEALVPMIHLVDQVVDQDHSVTQIPHLMVYSPNDQVIRVDRILSISEQMENATVELVEFTDSSDPYQHVLAGEACSPATTAKMVSLLKNYIDNLVDA